MNVDGVDSNSEIDEEMTKKPPDIADEANAAKQDLVSKKSGGGDLYNIDNVDHKVEDLHFFVFCEKKATRRYTIFFCHPIYSTSILTVKCTARGKETINCTNAVDCTVAHFRCGSFYEDSRLARPATVYTDGKWRESVPDCRPVCGKSPTTKD
ncbi:hypothetical protein MTP99_004656 [Tenebrio molitor]|nr:hypothetical protein MTP99_004656 [Tenebrio molitor]